MRKLLKYMCKEEKCGKFLAKNISRNAESISICKVCICKAKNI